MDAIIKADLNMYNNHGEQKLPLLHNMGVPDADRSLIQRAISQTFQSTAHLANLLPTGTVLAFQLLSPIVTNQGNCDSVCKFMTATVVALCGASCFLQCFTDSFRNDKGNVCYGLATFKGLWVIDGSATLPPELGAKFRLKFIDFMHAVMSILVFAAVALFDQNVVNCFFPSPSTEAREILTVLPVATGIFCSMLFVAFPTHRHGIGFPLSPN
ncbi:hypothetical protein VIGAN_01120000 [Vigna angularis var. angularis]|uniref:Uncharacterized protein n=1 Tax=Vigna angularis var. angularis TaxID=157739 RepID=A0A0S3QZG1_PHAAN|nr:hypothetical protein VIGAN_01120000 [Vigna angularis var. angularis]